MTLFAYSCNTPNQTIPDVITTATVQENSLVAPVTPTPYDVVSLPTHQEALEQMYGKDLSIYPNNKASITSKEGMQYDIHINVFSCYWEASITETCLVITARSQCVGCSSYIDGAVFNRTYKGWNLRSFRSNISVFGSLGKAPKGEIIQIGPEKYAVQFKWIYASQGNTVEHLVIIAETGSASEYSFGVILDIVSRGEKWISSEKIEYGWNTNLYFQKTDENSRYYDLIVTYYGDVKGMPYSEFYTFSNGKYNLVSKKSN